MRDRKVAYIVLMERSEGKEKLGRTKCRWEDNIKMCLHELGQRGTDLIYLGSE
jgi:hypothetical protein